VSQDLGCKFLCEHTEAMATCMFHITRLLVMSFTEAAATIMIQRLPATSCNGGYGHIHALSTLCYVFRRKLRLRSRFTRINFHHDLGWSLATKIAFIPSKSISSTGLYQVCWMGSHEELPQLHPESLHSG
jgi:hypothetical protein